MDKPAGDPNPNGSESGEQPAEHWANNAENLQKFWGRVKTIVLKYELSVDPHTFAHQVAGVDSLKLYTGAGADLIAAIEAKAQELQPPPRPYVPLTEAEIRRRFNRPQKGRAYLDVTGRILLFKLKYPLGSIDTELIRFDDLGAVFKSTIRDDQGNLLATGFGYATAAKTAHLDERFVQMAETNSIGRALLHAGFGTDMPGIDAEDVGQARRKGKNDQKPPAAPPPSRRLN